MGPPRQERLQPHLDTSSYDVDGNNYQSSPSPPPADESLHIPSLNYPSLPASNSAGISNKYGYSPHPSNESSLNPNATPPPTHHVVADPHTKLATDYHHSHQPADLPQWPQPPPPVDHEPNPKPVAIVNPQPELPQWPQPPPTVRHEPNPEPPIVNPQTGYSHQPEVPQWPQQPSPPVRPEPPMVDPQAGYSHQPGLPPPPIRPEQYENPQPHFVNLQPGNNLYHQQNPQKPIVIPQMGAWTTELYSCHEDATNCVVTAFCPCITFGQIAEIVDQGHTSCGTGALTYSTILCCCWVPCIYSCSYRTKLRAKFNLDGAPFIDTLLHCVFEPCALCQEYRELANRGLDPAIGWVGNLERHQHQQQAAMAPPSSQGMYK